MSSFFQIWNLISYSVQLILASSIIIFFSQKKSHWKVKYLITVVTFIGMSAVLSQHFEEVCTGIGLVGFWATFNIGILALFYFCTSYSLPQVVYYSIVALAIQHVAYDLCQIFNSIFGSSPVVEIIVYAVIYTVSAYLIRLLFAQIDVRSLNFMDVIPLMTILLIVLLVSVMYEENFIDDNFIPWNYVFYRIVDGLCCIYILWSQGVRRQREYYANELAGINQAFLLQTEQYKIRQEIIDSINRKCHDLKHQLEAMHHMENDSERERYYNELKKDIMIYDMAIDTGNEALNILIMDKGRYCYENDIQLSCMADAGSLSFMKLEDVYAMFGNAIDNAITAVEKLDDKEKRIVNLKVLNQNNLLMVQLQNYFEGRIRFKDGLPLTTKKDKLNHGFGVKSIRYLAEKYDGTMTVNTKNNIFTLQILLPIQMK